MADKFVAIIYTHDRAKDEIKFLKIMEDQDKAKEQFGIAREKFAEKYQNYDSQDSYGQTRMTVWYLEDSAFSLVLVNRPVS